MPDLRETARDSHSACNRCLAFVDGSPPPGYGPPPGMPAYGQNPHYPPAPVPPGGYPAAPPGDQRVYRDRMHGLHGFANLTVIWLCFCAAVQLARLRHMRHVLHRAYQEALAFGPRCQKAPLSWMQLISLLAVFYLSNLHLASFHQCGQLCYLCFFNECLVQAAMDCFTVTSLFWLRLVLVQQATLVMGIQHTGKRWVVSCLSSYTMRAPDIQWWTLSNWRQGSCPAGRMLIYFVKLCLWLLLLDHNTQHWLQCWCSSGKWNTSGVRVQQMCATHFR